jgi:hypothetical protein
MYSRNKLISSLLFYHEFGSGMLTINWMTSQEQDIVTRLVTRPTGWTI